MPPQTFKIRGMDCAEEIALLKREVGPLAGGEDSLSFDLINGKMTVDSEEAVAPGSVERAVRRTGMEAIPWESAGETEPGVRGLWKRHGRSVTCSASGVLLATGFVSHGAMHTWWDALTGGEATGLALPAFVTACYAAAVATGGWYIFPKAWLAARRLRPDMNLLMTVAVLGAIGIGEWFEAATVTFLFSLALLLESWSVGRARKAIRALMDLSPARARYICPHDGDIMEKPVEDVPLGATVIVRPGEKIPLDGVVSSGRSNVNQAPITGESTPVMKEPGAEVFAGTINDQGAFEFEVTKTAADTTLARIIRMVEEAQSRRAPSDQWVEKFARIYTPAMMGLAAAVALFPPLLLGGAWETWFYHALVLLVIACPCALVISTPVTIVAGLTSAAKAGVLIKGGAYLEAPARIRALALDKTGTLTFGEPVVQRVTPLNGYSEAELLERAAALEYLSEHPLARAILRRAEEIGVSPPPVEGFQAIKGKGAEGWIGGVRHWIGSQRFASEHNGTAADCEEQALALEDAGHSVVVLCNEEGVLGLISVADAVRPGARDAVEAMRQAGVREIVMLTGDNEGTARAVAEATGVDRYEAGLMPGDKAAAVEALAARHGHAAMVGDGINDAPAMAASGLGIAMGAAGTDAAIETADIALMADDLDKVPWLIHHSRRTVGIIKQNIVFALGLKALFIALALAGWATLWMAIAADMGASLLVISNGLRLLRASDEPNAAAPSEPLPAPSQP